MEHIRTQNLLSVPLCWVLLPQLPQTILILRSAIETKDCALGCGGLYWAPRSSLNSGYICQSQQLNCVAAFGVILLSALLSEVGCDVKCLISKCYGKMVICMFQGSCAFFIRSHCCDNQVTSLIPWNILMQILCKK